jgi:phosphoribosylamine--glycine ligase
MRFAYHSLDGATLSWARRLCDEGHEVLFYCKKDHKNKIGQGIVPVATNLAAWRAWGMQDSGTIYFFDQTASGEYADQLKKAGCTVVGGGAFMDRLELERAWGTDIAERAGVLCPPTHSFGSISEAITFLKSNPKQQFGDGGWAWKPDKDIGCDATLVASDGEKIIEHIEQIRRRFSDNLKCILQEKIDGVAVSTARWWNGKTWVGPLEGTLENKKFMDHDLGPATGCSFNMVWFYRNKDVRIAQELHFEQLADAFRANKAPVGLYDINCILDERGAWFLEWTPRLGIDSEITSQRGITKLGEFLHNLAFGLDVEQFFDTDQVYFDVRVTVPPYPNNISSKDYISPSIDFPVKGEDGLWNKMFVCGGLAFNEKQGLHSADTCGIIGFIVSSGNSIKKTYDKIYKYIEEGLQVPDLQYRTDAAEAITKDMKKMIENGWELSPVIKR